MLKRADFVIAAATIALQMLTAGGTANAQQSAPQANEPVKQAAFDRPAPGAAAKQSVRFGRREAHVGDQIEQKIALEMRLTLNMRRANEIIGKQQTTVRTNQRRIVTSTAVDAGRTMEVKVQYAEATKQLVGSPEQPDAIAGEAANAAADSQPAPESVQGKTYICRREPGANGNLIVTDEAGNRPPAEELEIVAQQMDVVGRPNPLAQFLSGRSISTGEKIELPSEIAKQVFNLGESFGDVTHFTLTLQKVQPENGASCAVFLASVEAASNDASQMRLQVEGPLVVQVETCRAARVNLAGPIGMSETRGSYSTAYQVIGTGRLQVGIASTFREAQR